MAESTCLGDGTRRARGATRYAARGGSPEMSLTFKAWKQSDFVGY